VAEVSEPVVIVEQRGSAADLHELDPFADGPPAGPQLWWCRFDPAAIVLGSRQTPDLLDAERCADAGLEIARRRSGGGAVVLQPGAVVWIDVVMPHGVAPDDVRGSMVWAGEAWRAALGVDGLQVHDGGLIHTPWSDLVCFAGVGPGEVMLGSRKLVGVSQRRTRHGVRVQGLVHRRPPISVRDLFAVASPEGEPPGPVLLSELGLGRDTDADLVDRLAAAVAARITPV
jgi:hypothetical protein